MTRANRSEFLAKRANTLNMSDEADDSHKALASLISSSSSQPIAKTDNSESGLCYSTLFDADYSFRMLTESIFEPGAPEVVFDIFLTDSDPKLKEFSLYDNLWRETILIQSIKSH